MSCTEVFIYLFLVSTKVFINLKFANAVGFRVLWQWSNLEFANAAGFGVLWPWSSFYEMPSNKAYEAEVTSFLAR